jgi:hypothetical protein
MFKFPSGRTARAALGVSVLAALAPVAVAQATTQDVTVAVSGASSVVLSAPTYGNFAAVTLNGSAQDTSASVSAWNVNDATGTGAGWSVNVSADVPHNADSSKTQSGAAMTLAAPTAAAADNTNTATAPAVAGGDILSNGGVNVADAAPGSGQGAWSLAQGSADLTLTVPADTLADSYTSTITTTLNPAV